jgi:hypothetical protein
MITQNAELTHHERVPHAPTDLQQVGERRT